MASRIRELRDYVEDIRSKLLTLPDVAKVELIGAQDEEITIEFQHDRVAALGIDYPALFNAVAAQNIVLPSGVIRTGGENVALQVSGAFKTERDILDVNIRVGDRIVRLGDIAQVGSGLCRSAASACFAPTGILPSDLAWRCAMRAISWRLGATSSQ